MSAGRPEPKSLITWRTAASVAIANMIGTGVFTSLGFQLQEVRTGFALLSLWVVGGLFALCGALTYGELAARLPRSGGELNFLGRIYHPALGFLAGWISFIMGFALPVALAAMAFGSYFQGVIPIDDPRGVSCALVIAVTVFHLISIEVGAWFQNIFTAFKIVLILLFIAVTAVVCFSQGQIQPVDFSPSTAAWGEIFSAPFAVSLLYVMFAYSGWNASTYIVDEIADPGRSVPKSLLIATVTVTVLYAGLNWAFLVSAPAEEMVGQVDVGHVSALYVFGPQGGKWMSALLCSALVSTISAMTWAGPRVTQVLGQDYAFFRRLADTNRHGIPVLAILTQTTLVIALLITSSFQSLLVYTQFVLALSSGLAVLGVFILRRRQGEESPYLTWGYPVTPLIFLAISLTTLIFTLIRHPSESLLGLLTVLLGLPIYWLSPRIEPDFPKATLR